MDNRNKTQELKNKVEEIKKDLPQGSIDKIIEKEKENAKPSDDDTIIDDDVLKISEEEDDEPELGDDEDLEDDSLEDDDEEEYDSDIEDEEDDDDENLDVEPKKEPSKTPSKPSSEENKDKQPSIEELYSESSKEAMALHFRNKKLVDTIAESIEDPTDEQLAEYAKEMGTDIDALDTLAKNLLKDSLKNKLKDAKIQKVLGEAKEVDAWAEKVEAYIEDESNLNKYPSLQNNADAFKAFANKGSRRGMDFDDLVGLFLFKQSQDKPKRKKKKSLLLDKGNGRNQPPAKKALTTEDLRRIRKTRGQKAYKEALKTFNAQNKKK